MHWTRGLFIMALLLLLGASLRPAHAQANTYYVATNGSDTNPGTEAAPFRTINRGVRDLKPGDTLLIKTGVYAEELNNSIPTGQSWTRPVTVRAYPGHTVTVMPNAGAQRVITITRNRRYIIIDGLILDGTNTQLETVKIAGNSDPALPSPHHIRLINNHIRNAAANRNSNGQYRYFAAGIMTTGQSNYVEYINNHIYNNGVTDYDHGIYHQSSNGLIAGNVIYGNMGSGIKIGWQGQALDNVVRDNLIYNNNAATGADGQKKQGRGIGVYSGRRTLVYNNIIWGHHHSAIDVTYGGHNAKIFNNTVHNSTGWGILVGFGQAGQANARNTIVRNNIVYQESREPAILNQRGVSTIIEYNLTFGTNTTIGQQTAATIRNNLVNRDPLFNNFANRDFSLRAGSPAVDAGMTTAEVTTDFAGRSRPQGARYDLGALERVASAAQAPQEPPVISGPTVQTSISASADTVDVAVNLYNISDLYGLQASCNTDSAVLAGAGLTGGAVFNEGNSLFVDQGDQGGRWLVAVSRMQPEPAFSGDGLAFTLRYQRQSSSGSAVDCDWLAVDVNGRPVEVAVINTVLNDDGTTMPQPIAVPQEPAPSDPQPVDEVEMLTAPGTISGTASYQGRTDQSGITVQLLLEGEPLLETTTDTNGAYQFEAVPGGSYTLRLSAPLHLGATLPAVLDGEPLQLDAVTLVAGDVDSNAVIDILDAALIGANFNVDGASFPAGDLNADAVVNILDLVLVGTNFGSSE